jgi:hypothetical protein
MATHTLEVAVGPGAFTRDLVAANVQSVTKRFNSFSEMQFTFPKHDPAGAAGQAADMIPLETRVRFWRDGDTDPYFHGLLVKADADTREGAVSCTAMCIGWPILNRLIGRARDNYLLNADFDAGADDWTASAGLTATPVTDPRRTGTQALRLEGAGETLTQDFDITGTAIGTNVYFAISYYVETVDASDDWDQVVIFLDSPLGDGQISAVAYLDPTRTGEWIDAVVAVPVPASTTWTLTATVRSPGSIVVDFARAVIPESLSFFDADIADIMGGVVSHLQDTGLFDASADYGLTVDTPTTGITLPAKDWQFADYIQAINAIGEMQNREDGPDWAIVYTAAGPIFRTFWPSKGTDRSATITLQRGVNLENAKVEADGAAQRKEAVYYGEGDGPHRPEGRASDYSNTNIPLMQSAEAAPIEADIDDFAPLAAGKLADTVPVPRRLTLITVQRSGDLVGVLDTGDIVNVVIDDGWLQVAGDCRIVDLTYRPRTETLEITALEV